MRPTPPPHHPTRPTIVSTSRGSNGRRGGAARGARPAAPHRAAQGGSLAERVRRDPALLARALADPGLRSQLPDRYLTPEQLKTRRNHQFLQDIGDLNTPLSGDSLVNVAQTLTDRDLEPLLKDIDRSSQAVDARRTQQQTRAADYYRQLAAQGNSTIAGQEAATLRAQQAAQEQAAGSEASVNTSADQAQAQAAHDAQVRGADVQGDMIAQMAADRAAGLQRAAAEGQQTMDTAKTNGDAMAAFLRGTQAATAQQGGETQGQIAARGDADLNDLAAQRAKLIASKPGQFTDTLMKLRQGEVDRTLTERGLANDEEKAVLDYKSQVAQLKSQAQIQAANRQLKLRLTQMGLDSKAAQAEADRATQEAIAAGHDATSRANTAATTATSAANNQRTVHQSDVNSRRAAHARGGAGGFTHQQLAKSAQTRDNALTLAQQYKNRRASRDVALQLLTEKYGSDFARVAVGAIYDGGAKPHLESLMEQRYGIHIPKQYRTRPR